MSVKSQGQETLLRRLGYLREKPIHTKDAWVAEVQEVVAALQLGLPDTQVHLTHANRPGPEFVIRLGPRCVGNKVQDILILRIFPWGNAAFVRLYWVCDAPMDLTYAYLCAEGREPIHAIGAVALEALSDAVVELCDTSTFQREVLHHRYLALPPVSVELP